MITDSIDFAQVILYVFWAFFFSLIFWLRREDRREGYPLENDTTGALFAINPIFIPPPKTFLLPHGGSVQAPNFERDRREIHATRVAAGPGSAIEPVGDALLSGLGPATYAMRHDQPELTRDGQDAVVPFRVAKDYSVSFGADPRGFEVVAGDGKVAGVIKDIWVDRADSIARYLEVELSGEGAGRRLIPVPMLRILGEPRKVEVVSVFSTQFASVPTLRNPDQITELEEEKISAFYAGGRLYAEPKRLGPLA